MMTDTSNLALIYSRLADLESQRDSSVDILQTIAEKHSLHKVDSATVKMIEERFEKACDEASLVDSIKLIFEEEHKIKDDITKSLTANTTKHHSQKLNRDQLVADSFRLKENLKTLRPQVLDMGELCRSLQVLDKEKAEHHAKVLLAEQQKTLHIENECGASLGSVTTKIDAEEADINAKAQENEELKVKLEQFKGHLELRREKVRNEQRTKELTEKLELAKLAQKNYLEEQEKLKRDSVKSKIIHTSETVAQLEQQLLMYDRKFQEFESTLTRTNEIMTQLAERELSLLTVVSRLRTDHSEWAGRASQAEVGLAGVLGQKKAAEDELSELKAVAQRTEKKLRKLQARRKEVMSGRAAHSTPSSSSSSSAVAVRSASPAEALSSSSSSASPARNKTHTTAMDIEQGVVERGARETTGAVGEGSPVASPVKQTTSHA